MLREWLPHVAHMEYKGEFELPSYSEYYDILDGKKSKQEKQKESGDKLIERLARHLKGGGDH